MRLDFVGLAPGDVDPAAICSPAGNARGKMFVGVSDPLVIFLAIFVFVSIGIGIASPPKFFDKAFAFVVGCQLLESLSLLIGDDVGDVLVQPVLVGSFQFWFDVAWLLSGILLPAWFCFLCQPRRNGKTSSQKSDGQTAETAW